MSATYRLEIFTPEYQFFDDEVEALTITTTDGQWTVLRGHAPLIAPLVVGQLSIKKDGAWRKAFQSEGFLVVEPGCTRVFVQACEWPEDIDMERAQAAKERALGRMKRQQSREEYEWSRIALARATERLKIKQ